MNKALIVILMAIGLDAVGIGLIFPILPELLRAVSHLGHVAPLYGAMLSVYALMQFVFSPVLGILSDRYGRRPVLILSLAGAAIDYVIMAVAGQVWLLFVGRMLAGLTSANMAVATAYLTDISTPNDRARRFGYMHAMFGIGFVIGPLLGGALGEVWIRAPFVLAAVLNFVNFLLALFVLPESRTPGEASSDAHSLNPVRPLLWAFKLPGLLPFLAVFAIFSLVGQVYGSVWVLYGGARYDWSPLMVGISLAAYGILHALVQAVLPGPAVARLGERGALLLGLGAEALALIVMGFSGQGWVVFVLMPLFALGGIGVPALQSLTTRSVDPDHQGRLQGVLSGLMSLTAIIGPALFSLTYFATAETMPGFVWVMAASIYVLIVPISAHFPRATELRAPDGGKVGP